MKLESYEESPPMRRKTPKIYPLVALIILVTIPLYFTSIIDSSKKLSSDAKITFESPKTDSPCTDNYNCHGDQTAAHHQEPEPGSETQEDNQLTEKTKQPDLAAATAERCDLSRGEWVANPDGPYYTNATCYTIQAHQNCLQFGRSDLGYLKWRWKPDDCELPLFDPNMFLELMRGKSIAFVGDSVARNHMQSLICMLGKVANPVDLSEEFDQNRRYEYPSHGLKIFMFWTPYLVKTGDLDREPFNLYLDEFNHLWTEQLSSFHYILISAGHWFFRPTYFYLNNTRIGCLYCPDSNVTQFTPTFSYRWAFQTAFRAINAGFKGVTILRTFAPKHFENGDFDSGGDCVRTRPFKRNETQLEGYGKEFYQIQLEEFGVAEREVKNGGVKFRLMDVTEAMLYRPDGHPSQNWHLPDANRTFRADCVHWCLPGPIDSWNDFLQEMIQRETKMGEGDDTIL